MSDAESILDIRMLSAFSVELDGCAVANWSRRSALCLLQSLALSPDFRASRAQLLDILTQGNARENARCVSDALYALKRQAVIGHPAVATLDAYISSSPEAVWLDKKRCRVDIAEFETAIETVFSPDSTLDQVSAIIGRCSGPLLPDVAAQIEPVAASTRIALEQKYLTGARKLVALCIQADQGERAILALQNVLRAVPSDEESHRQLIEIFATLGRYHEAEQQLSLCRAVLARDLGIRPSDTTINSIRNARSRRLSEAESIKTVSTPPPSATTTTRPARHSPPKPLVKLIGRGATIEELQNLLASDDGPRLITLCGVGGVGKTQLALQIADRCAALFHNGAAFVDLTRVTDEPGVARIMAMTLGLKREQKQSWQDQLAEQLKPLKLLLVLDNFEHVHRAAPWLASLIEGCAELVVLCTSRVPLLVHGEYVYAVAPLTLSRANGSTDGVCISEAAHLFLSASRGSHGDVTHTSDALEAIEALCKKLDGLPLAIELAAARASIVGVERLKEQLNVSEISLRNPMQDAPARHASLRQLLASICEVLDDRARLALVLAAHFEAGFTSQQLALSEMFSADERDVVLTRLLDSRIISTNNSSDDVSAGTLLPPRFRLLETVRSYVRHSDWVDAATHAKAAEGYVRIWHRTTKEIKSARYTSHERNMLKAFASEFENISSAIRIAARIDKKSAREMLFFIWWPSVRGGHDADWISWAESAFVNAESEKTADHINLLTAASEVYRTAMQFSLAQHVGEIAVRGAQSVVGADVGAAHRALARAYGVQGEFDQCAFHADEALIAAYRTNDEIGELDAFMLKSTLDLFSRGHIRESAHHANRARELCVKLGIEEPHPLVIARGLSMQYSGNLFGARELFQSAAKRYCAEGEKRAESDMAVSQAECELLALDLDQARNTLERARTMMDLPQNMVAKYELLRLLGALHVLQNESEKALIELRHSMESIPEDTKIVEADLTLIWLVYAHLLAQDLRAAIAVATELTSEQIKVRRFIAPFAIEAVASTFIMAEVEKEALVLSDAAAKMRLVEGLPASPAEKLIRARFVERRIERTSHGSPFEELEDVISYAHSALSKLSAPRATNFARLAEPATRMRLVKKQAGLSGA